MGSRTHAAVAAKALVPAAALALLVTALPASDASASSPPTMLLDPAKVEIDGDLGETFTVDVVIDGIADLGAFQFELHYEDVYFNVDIQEGPFLGSTGNATTCFKSNLLDDIADFSCVTLGAVTGVSGTGVVATIEFTVTSTSFSIAQLLMQACLAADPDGDQLALNDCKDGDVNVLAPAPVGGISFEPGPTAGGGAGAGTWVGVVALGVVALAGASWLAVRRRSS